MLSIFNSARCFTLRCIAASALAGASLCVVVAADAQPPQAAPPAVSDSSDVLWHKIPYDGTVADQGLADGIKAYNAGNFDLAIAAFSKAFEIRPKFAAAHYYLGLTFISVKDYDRATAEFTKVIEIKPKLSDAWVELGEVCLKRGDFEKAELNAEEALKVKPTNKDAIQLLKDIGAAQASGK